MVSSMLIGRLGNSLFQIAASIGYARKYGYQWGVSTNIRESKVFDFFPNMPRCTDGSGFRYNEQEQGRRDWFDYHEIPNKGPNTFLVGFFQSLEYFRHCQEEVKKVFALPHISGYENHVAIHVRRTDYVEHSGSFPPVTPGNIIRKH